MEGTVTTPATDAPETNVNTPAAETPATDNGDGKQTDLEKIVQQAVDRATNKLGNENKKLRADLEAERKKNLSENDLKKLELSEKQKELDERAKELADEKNRWFAMKAIREAGLDNGKAETLSLVDFVMSDDEEGIKAKVKSFDALVKHFVQEKVDAVFKANGRTPGVGSETAAAAGGQHGIAVRLGKEAAATSQHSRETLDKYIGG